MSRLNSVLRIPPQQVQLLTFDSVIIIVFYWNKILLLADVDFIGTPVTLVLSNALKSEAINISILDDSLIEQAETIQLVLTTSTSDLVVASSSPLQIEILDNDGM